MGWLAKLFAPPLTEAQKIMREVYSCVLCLRYVGVCGGVCSECDGVLARLDARAEARWVSKVMAAARTAAAARSALASSSSDSSRRHM